MHRIARGSLGACLCGILGSIAGAPASRAQEAEAATALEATERAQVAAADLADSLRWVEGSLRSAAPLATGGEALTKDDNDRLIESATKNQLAGMAAELDQLSATIARGSDGETTSALLESVDRRAAALSELGRRTDHPVIPADQMQSLMDQWKALHALPVAPSSAESVPETPQ